MRLLKGLAVCSGAFSLAFGAGCSSGGSERSAAGSAATASGPVAASFAPPAAPVSPQLRATARAAAAQFYALYSTSQFAAFWSRLAAPTKSHIPEHVWVSVHEGCPSGAAGNSRVIKAVTVFGNAAIVTESMAGPAAKPDTTEDVFNLVNGQWSYSPGDMSIYHHGSVAADIAAAKAAGVCASWKIF
jgi:hypothetical protein